MNAIARNGFSGLVLRVAVIALAVAVFGSAPKLAQVAANPVAYTQAE